MIFMSAVLNNFIMKRLKVKSSDLTSTEAGNRHWIIQVELLTSITCPDKLGLLTCPDDLLTSITCVRACVRVYNFCHLANKVVYTICAVCPAVALKSRSFTNLAKLPDKSDQRPVLRRSASTKSSQGNAAKQQPQRSISTLDSEGDTKAQAKHLKAGRSGSFREGYYEICIHSI